MAEMNPTSAPPASTPDSQPKKSPWLKRGLIIAAVLIVLPLMTAVIARLVYNDNYIREKVQSALRDATGREVTVEGLECSILSGTLSITNVTVPNSATGYKNKDTAHIAAIRAQFSPFSIAFSSGKNISNAKVLIQKPEIIVERRGRVPLAKTNIDDLLEKFLSGPPGTWPKQTGLTALNAEIAVEDGAFTFIDSDPKLGESRLEKLNVTATQPGLGQPLDAKIKFALQTPSEPAGQTDIDAKINWIGADGSIDYHAFKDILVNGRLQQMDVPHVLRHAGFQARLKEGRYICTLGKPQTGTFKLEAPTLEKISFVTKFDTDGALSIFEGTKWVAGNLPGNADINAQFSFTNGQFREGPISARFLVAESKSALSDAAKQPLLKLEFNASAAGGANRTYGVVVNTAEELFKTDIAAVLDLKDNIGGIIDGKIDATIEESGHARIDGVIRTKNGFVKVNNVRQGTSIDANFAAKLEPNADGRPDKAELTFNLNAGTALTLGSTRAAKISSLSDPRAVAADAEMNLKLSGREFWKEFGPLLNVLGFGTPLEESLTGTVRLSGSSGKLTLALDGTLQQQNEKPNPLRLNIAGDYDGNALAERNDQPWLKLVVALKSAADKSVDLKIPITISVGKTQRVYEMPEFPALGDLQGITQLNDRFGAYTSIYSRDHKFSGFIKQSGKSKLIETLDEKSNVTARHLTFSTEVNVLQLHVTGPALFKNAPALNYAEDSFALKMELEYKEQGKSQTLTIKPVALKSNALNIDGELGEIDVAKLRALAGTEPKLSDWVALLPQAHFEASVNADGVRQLQSNGVLPPEELAQGDLLLKLDYNSQTRRAALQSLRFRNAGLNVNLNAADVDAPVIAALLDKGQYSASAALEVLPTLGAEISLRKPLLDRLKQLQLAPPEVDLVTDITLKAAFDRAKKTLALETLSVNGPGIEGQIAAPAVNAINAAAALDAPPKDLAGLSALLTNFQADVKVKAPALDALKARGLAPADPIIRGELALKTHYDAASDRLAIETASFQRADQATVPLSNAEFSCESVRLAALLKELPKISPALLAHFEKGVNVKAVTLAPVEALQLLQRQKIGGPAVDEMLAGVVRFPQPWTIKDFVLKPTEKPGAYSISLDSLTPVSFHQRPEPGQPPAQDASAWLSGVVRLDPAAPFTVEFKDGGVGARGIITLDGADIQARRFGFEKPAGTPCGYSINGSYGAGGSIRVATFASVAGPWSFTLSDLAVLPTKITLQKFEMSEGPIKGTLSNVAFDSAADALKATLETDTVDVGKLYAMAPLSPRLKVSGIANALKVNYDGRLSALQSGKFATTDKLTASMRPALRIDASSASESVAATLNGDLTVSPQRLFSKVLAIEMDHSAGGAHSISKVAASLDVAPREANELLLNALSQPGLPLIVKVPISSEQLIDLDGILGGVAVIADAASPGPAKPKTPGDNSGIAKLRVETQITAPQVKAGIIAQLIDGISARMDSLMVDIPSGAVKLYGGIVKLENGRYNMAFTPLKHEQKVTLTNLDIGQAAPKPADKTSYEYTGMVSGTINLKGSGFEQRDRATWNGDIDLTIHDLVARRESESIKETATKTVAGIIGQQLDDFTGRVLNIFSEDFGLFLKKMEFEPFKVVLKIENGVAHIQRGSIIGKGGTRSEGLQVDFAGSVNLAANAFGDEGLRLILVKLPPGTQKQLRLDQLDEADRNAELEIFAQGKFTPIIIGGTLDSAGVSNKLILTNEFMKMDSRISKKIKEKKARDSGQPQPAGDPGVAKNQPTDTKPEKDEPKSLLGGIEDLLKKQIKKKKE